MGKARLAITMGDPSGIGPEIIAKALLREDVSSLCHPVIYGDGRVMVRAFRLIGRDADSVAGGVHAGGRDIEVINPLGSEIPSVTPGIATREGAKLMMASVKGAALDALEGLVAGMVTCPINKEAIALTEYSYRGHTEFIRDLTKTGRVVMMLAGENLKVALATIHVSLSEAISLLSEDLVFETLSIVHGDFINKFGIRDPRIAVAGLNPHGGEGGLLGREEIEVIAPALLRAREKGISASGPFPPDTIFYRAFNGEFDVVLCMYHDQGLIPLKLVHFDTGVNVTLGLPIVRTSVDHGTAYDIAWKGEAKETSLVSAISLAQQMVGKDGGR